ncbi:sugar phosphate isomerase/epimerase [Isosphaeraceae bacterium EP7]
MKLCIAQATTMSSTFEADLQAYSRAGFPAVELWLTKLEEYIREHGVGAARDLLASNTLTPLAAAGQGGLLLSERAERQVHWDLFRARLELLRDLGVPTMVVAVDFVREMAEEDYGKAAMRLREAGTVAADHGVRIALEFQKTARFCSSLDTTIALVMQASSPAVGVCFDLFHYYTGPSKFEDLAYLSPSNLAWVQLCDVAGTPREIAGDADRIFPGEGDFQITPILDHLAAIGYEGGVSLEVLNPLLWSIPADRVADMGYQAMSRALGDRALGGRYASGPMPDPATGAGA